MIICIYVRISLIYNRNISGSNTVPWGTPAFTETSLDAWFSRISLWLCLVTHCSIHLIRSPWIPQFLNLQSKRLWGTMSKALQKSSHTRSTCFLLSIAFKISSVRDKSWLWQEYSGLKPCWHLLMTLGGPLQNEK